MRREFHIKGINLAGAEASLVIVAASAEDARRIGESIGLEQITVTPMQASEGHDDQPTSKPD